MDITIIINEYVFGKAQKIVQESDKSLSPIVEEALEHYWFARHRWKDRPRVELTTVGGGGLRPGVNLDSNEALLDFLEDGKWDVLDGEDG